MFGGGEISCDIFCFTQIAELGGVDAHNLQCRFVARSPLADQLLEVIKVDHGFTGETHNPVTGTQANFLSRAIGLD